MNELPVTVAGTVGLSYRASSPGWHVRWGIRYLRRFFFWKRNPSLLFLHSPCFSHASALFLCPPRRSICCTACSVSPVSQATHPASQSDAGKLKCIYIIWMGELWGSARSLPCSCYSNLHTDPDSAPTAHWNTTMNKWCVPSARINYLVLMLEQNSLSV